MSSPSTPARSIEPSTSSPVKDANNTQNDQLTPRSKVRAMLAALDSSDEDNLSKPTSTVSGDARTRLAQALKKNSYKHVESHGKGGDNDDESDRSGDDGDMAAPRGKLASRLYRQRAMKQDQSHTTTEDNATYRRIQQQILQQQKQPSIDEGADATTSDQSEKENGITRKLLKRPKRRPAIDPDSDQSCSKSPQSQGSSPGLFLTPKKSGISETVSNNRSPRRLSLTPEVESSSAPRKFTTGSGGLDSGFPSDPNANSRFLALVARKRAEREAKEASERKKKQEKTSRLGVDWAGSIGENEITRGGVSEDDSENEAAGGIKLTQQSRPTRKASKKALEEMKRETQRMSRNMQLAHQAKTKKKITKESLLARFNFGGRRTTDASAVEAISSSLVGSSAHVSDTEGAKEQETPPTSPILPVDDEFPKTGAAEGSQLPNCPIYELREEIEDDLPSVDDIMAPSVQQSSNGKGKEVEEAPLDTTISLNKSKRTKFSQPAIKIKPPNLSHRRKGQQNDSDSELEILPMDQHKPKQRDIFEHLRTQKVTQTRPLQTVRALAHLTSPSKQKPNSRVASTTPLEMQKSLQKLARQQAARERAEKIQDLKDRGIIIQTAEEIERDQADLEDLLEKARKEAEQITKKEKDDVKKERRDNGEADLEDSSDDDEEYKEEKTVVSEVEYSGSEEEEEDGDDNEDEDEEVSSEEDEDGNEWVILGKGTQRVEDLIDNAASEDSQEDDSDQDADIVPEQNKRRNKISRVVDEEDEEDNLQQDLNHTDSPKSLLIPNLDGCNDAPMGLTQAFAATMADSQTQNEGTVGFADEEQDSLAFLRGMPEPDFPMIDADAGESMIPNSQPEQLYLRDTSQLESGNTEINLHLTQSQIDYERIPEVTEAFAIATQCSEIPDPSQDVGFGVSSPIANRFVSVPPSTIETVILPEGNVNEAIVKKKGRLRRRLEATHIISSVNDENTASGPQESHFALSANAFDVLKQASKKSAPRDDPFIKDKSNAKTMVEEQAEESEDEYAGLGGASDDESGNEEDEEVRKMVDDGDVKVDERKLAAFHAYVHDQNECYAKFH